MAEFLAGIDGYRQHPYHRGLEAASDAPDVLWQHGSSRLLDYGRCGTSATVDPAPTVLFVPSLSNRAYILDLTRDRSLMRYLAASGIRPMRLDWGAPVGSERDFGLDDYIAGRLDAALDDAGQPVVLAGYCMGVLPVDVIQAEFAALDPLLAARKFSHFAKLAPKSAAARNFVALEDWLNDGVVLSGGVARECLLGWYGENLPARGRWQVAGNAVHSQRLEPPTLTIVPQRGRIVHPESAEPLSTLIPAVETWRPALGHIGMIASPRAKRSLWRALAAWINARQPEG